ncbi:MAG: hypothetical protein IID48_13350 [Proteobacteria bacterium]|nr:hypothetical protein [Pseudomonadota bacterium]
MTPARAAADGETETVLEVRDLKKYFPVKKGLLAAHAEELGHGHMEGDSHGEEKKHSDKRRPCC